MNDLVTKNGYRKLLASEAEKVVDLIRTTYGETYSYKDYYRIEFVADLIESGRLFSFGIFNEDGLLTVHTGLMAKDIAKNYFESVLSIRHPRRRPVKREVEIQMFDFIFNFAKDRSFFIHQNTTTYHHFAQASARKLMNTKYCGMIFGYAQGENISYMKHSKREMNAIMYTSRLECVNDRKDVYLPDNPWGKWLEKIIVNLEIDRRIQYCEPLVDTQNETFLTKIEDNPYLGLRRFAICEKNYHQFVLSPEIMSRTVLLHMPAKKEFVEKYFDILMSKNMIPVGYRPHQNRADEIIFQYLNIDSSSDENLEIKIFWQDEKMIFQQWNMLCKQII